MPASRRSLHREERGGETELPEEVRKGERFAFGENWRLFLETLDEGRIKAAEMSLQTMLETESLQGKTFLDVGSGSGLFSLAARRLGARVRSFDADPSSVWCTRELRNRYGQKDEFWSVEQGSILDRAYVEALGRFDVVYSWGVLHHTGDMWAAMDLVALPVRPNNGRLFLAIYNDQGGWSACWRVVKRTYCRLPRPLRPLILYPVGARFWATRILSSLFRVAPTISLEGHSRNRGMSAWTDLVDWVGGYPFEVAKPDEIVDFFLSRGFTLSKLKTVGKGSGNNEFVFERTGDDAEWA